jgi:cytochrome c
MKKKHLIIPALALIIATIAACNGGHSGSGSDSSASSGTPMVTTAAQDSLGRKLLVNNDCLTCHKMDVKLIGPAYQDVAAKYTATQAVVDTLAKKVINGGSGNWGQIAMSPHPNVSMDDARAMVLYILSQKK